ncbi:MAG TPA: hypothetical protein VK348_16060 [Planctomycetota bacterium]|nr:hypothetical protein [Planctomycetota bacterium]
MTTTADDAKKPRRESLRGELLAILLLYAAVALLPFLIGMWASPA